MLFRNICSKCSIKNLFWKFSQNSSENRVYTYNFIKKAFHLRCFPVNIFRNFQTIYSIELFLTITTLQTKKKVMDNRSFSFLFTLHFRVSIIYKSYSKVVAKLRTEYFCCKGWTNIRQDKTETDECSIRKNHFSPLPIELFRAQIRYKIIISFVFD